MAPLHVFSRARDFLVSEEELPAGQRDRRRGAATFTAALKFFVPGAISLQAANAIYRKLCNSGFDVLPVNPNAAEAEGVRCYPNLASIPGTIDGVVVAPSAPVLPVQLWHCPTENRLRALRCQG